MKKRNISDREKMSALRNEFKGSSDRSAAIIGGAFLEDLLEHMLRYFFIKNRKHDEIFFEGNGVLGTFSSKISLTYRLGLISECEYQTLETIRAIRNRFAHELTDLKFDEQSISAKCRNIEYPVSMITPEFAAPSENSEPFAMQAIQKASSQNSRDIFQESVMVLMNILIARLATLNAKKITPPKDYESAEEIANEKLALTTAVMEHQMELIKLKNILNEREDKATYSDEEKASDNDQLKNINETRKIFSITVENIKSEHQKIAISK